MRRKPARRRPQVALALRRRPRLRRALAAVTGVACGAVVMLTMQQAEGARERWGRTVPVLVATRDIPAGEALDASNSRVVGHPEPLVPAGALGSAPPRTRVSAALFAGEVVREERLAPGDLSSVAARLPEGTRAIAIPSEPGTTPPLRVGDLVDIVVALPTDAAGGGPPGFALATEVTVVDVSDQAATLAVPRDVAPRVAVAFGQGAITLALVGR